jgi:two-component system, LytTR family, response regulator
MNRLRAYLVDDEPLALKRLIRLLDDTGRVEITGSSTDPVEAVEQLRTLPCDVLFADIEMPDLSGFQMLARLGPQHPLVVFTTAYSQYALQAFEVHSVDYLLKPIDARQLDRALAKLTRVCGGLEPRPQLERLLEQLALALPGKKPFPSRLPSRLGDRIEFVEVARVTHFYANEKLTYASTPKKEFIVDYTVAQLEETLDPARFVRIHRSTIVNLEFVKELYSWFSDRMMLRINDGKDTELTVARDRVRTLKERLGL